MALLNRFSYDLNADKHSPASSARSTKRRVRGDASAGMDCECPLYWKNTVKKPEHLDFKGFQASKEQGMRESNSH